MKQYDALPNAFALGTVGYYLDFALAPLHDRYHHGDRTRFSRYVRFMERYHAGHHRGGETNFGVSSPLWDIVFGTRR